jgi:hypothetical protein
VLNLHPGLGGLVRRISTTSRVTKCYPRAVLEQERKPVSAQSAADKGARVSSNFLDFAVRPAAASIVRGAQSWRHLVIMD